MEKKLPKVLLVAATENELPKQRAEGVNYLVTGVGMVATTFALTKELSRSSVDLVVDCGIAGSFLDLAIGDVVEVVSDRIVEFGAEDNGRFISADELKLCAESELQFHTDKRITALPSANGITVNRVHGNQDTIEAVWKQFKPNVETMEGAAVAYVCQQFDVPWVQIRAISNKVEPRNRDAWNIPLALQNLHSVVENYLNSVLDEA